MTFSCSGQLNGKTNEQLLNFTEQLNSWFPDQRMLAVPPSWTIAFQYLKARLDAVSHQRKKVLFFDDLPWLDSHKSGFLSSFGHFWNNYASARKDMLVIICGSAASWIIDKVVYNKGGLHNRITRRIRLLPFNLKETQAYLQHSNIYGTVSVTATVHGNGRYTCLSERNRKGQKCRPEYRTDLLFERWYACRGV